MSHSPVNNLTLHTQKQRVRTLLWRWISIRMVALALTAILLVCGGMWLRFAWWENHLRAMIPAPVRQELEVLEAQPTEHRQRLLQIYGEYMYGEYFSDEVINEDLLVFGGFVLLSIPLILGGGVWMSWRLSRQLSAVAVAADQIAQGDFTARAVHTAHAPDALRCLANDFNRMARRLEQRERELQESSAATAHELRTPLTAAKGRLQGLLDGVFEPTAQNFQLIMRQLDQLNQLINDLYLLSLVSAKQLVLSPSCFSMRALAEERAAWAMPRLQELHMQVRLDIPAELYVQADRDRIGQVISIVLDNAMRYASSGGLIVISAGRQNTHTIMNITDDGPGFEPEHLERACDRFWRAESSRSRHAGGSGLGLAVAVAICQAHGGSFSVHNSEKGGARICISLPD